MAIEQARRVIFALYGLRTWRQRVEEAQEVDDGKPLITIMPYVWVLVGWVALVAFLYGIIIVLLR